MLQRAGRGQARADFAEEAHAPTHDTARTATAVPGARIASERSRRDRAVLRRVHTLRRRPTIFYCSRSGLVAKRVSFVRMFVAFVECRADS